MRRKDRELQSITDILQIIHQCKVCRVSFIDGNHPYLVPLNFGYAYKDGKLTLYFHGAKDGHKMELAAAGGCAAFEMDDGHKLIQADDACHHSYCYASVCGFGPVSVVCDDEKKRLALKHIVIHQTGKLFEFDEAMMEHTAVFKITAEEVYGKYHGKG